MKRRDRHNPWRKGSTRPHRPANAPVYPLPHARAVRQKHGLGRKPTAEETTTLPITEVMPGRRSQPRGIRLTAWLIIAVIPLTVLGWAGSIIVPTAIEANEAMEKVFVTPVERQHYVTPSASEPVTAETASPPTPTPAPTQIVREARAKTPTPTTPAPTPTPFPAWTGTEPVNILLLGVDTRAGESTPARSDTIIVVRVDPVAKRVDMLSIPRDLLVEIPGYFATKANAAYPLGEGDEEIPGGGPTLAAQMVELNFGMRINYFAEVDISGMERMIDTLGGVVLDVPGIVKDDQYPTENYGYTRVYFTPGLQLMDGRTAVQYSRTRHDDNDFKRQERQRQVLMAIRDRALTTGIITKLPELISEVGDSVRTDLSPTQALSLARLGQDIPRKNIYSHSLLPYVQDQWIDGGYYLVGDWETIRALAANLPEDPYATNAIDPVEIAGQNQDQH